MRHSHSRQRPLAGTLALLLAGKLHQAIGDVSVATDKLCYHLDEDIVISFSTDDPGEDDWVGIYPFNTVSGSDEPSMWVRMDWSVSGRFHLFVHFSLFRLLLS
jgi:hypothetical protein